MKKRIITLVFALLAVSAAAQRVRTSYFMDGSALRMSLNPALAPERGYIKIPALGGIDAGFNTNGLSLDKLLWPRDGRLVGFLDPSVPAADVLNGLKPVNTLDLDVDISLIGFGFWSNGRTFWSFDVNLRTDVGTSLPRGLFEFLKTGSGPDGRNYSLRDFGAQVTSYIEAGLGWSRVIDKRLTVGARLKYLVGIENISMHYDRLDLTMTGDRWAVEAEGRVDLSGDLLAVGTKTETDATGKPAECLDLESAKFGKFGTGGWGFGVDLGAEYRLLPNLRLSAAIVDMGLLKWSPKKTVAGRSLGNYTFDGFDIVNGVDQGIGTGDFEDFVRFEKTEPGKRNTVLQTTFVLGGEYSILRDRIGFGLLFTSQKQYSRFYTELTASVNFRPLDWFSASLSYSVVHSAWKTYGLAINFHPSWINFFIGTDYMPARVTPQWVPVAQRTGQVYFGLSVPVSKRRVMYGYGRMW